MVEKIMEKKEITFEETAVNEISQLRIKRKTGMDKLKELE